jgi:dTDP-N-acetylfucosamine:lipid II N-acetylfucosaminyltransferase
MVNRQPRFLHFIPDEKFVNVTVDLMARTGLGSHIFVVNSDSADGELRYADRDKVAIVTRSGSSPLPLLANELTRCDALVIHYLTRPACELILAAPSSTPVAWCGWGGDYYNLLPGGEDALFAPETRRIVESLRKRRAGHSINRQAKRLARTWLGPLRDFALYHTYWRQAIRRVNFFSAPIRPDFDLLRAALADDLVAEYCQFHYGSLQDDAFRAVPAPARRGHQASIQLGQSASAFGNHLDAALSIQIAHRQRVRLVVPMSYGDLDYRDEVLSRIGAMCFAAFDDIRQYLPLHEFERRVASCELAIFGSKRQHALGNILIALCQGRQVLLDPENPTFGYLRTLGVMVDAISDIDRVLDGAAQFDAAHRLKANVVALRDQWGASKVDLDARIFLSRLVA